MNINKNFGNNGNNCSISESVPFAWFKAKITEDHSFDVDCVSQNCQVITGVCSSLISECFSNFTNKILPDFRQKFLQDLSTALKTRAHIQLPVPVICETQQVRHLDFKAAPVEHGDLSYYFCILSPFSPTKEPPTVKKQKFLGMLIHEMRLPLTGILSSIDIMRHNQKTHSMDPEDYLKIIEQSGEFLLGMVDDLMEYSQSMSVYREDADAVLNLNDLFATAQNLIVSTIIKKRLRFEMRSHNPVPDLIRTHPKRLTQIINNLLSNAIKYTNHGTIFLEILGCEPIALGYNLVFSVRDTGIGMSEATQQKIFEPFFRGDEEASDNPGGSGLGLYIVKELVDSLQGTITCRSELGVGTEFLVQIVVHNP